MVFRALREKQSLEPIKIGQACSCGASFLGRSERLTIGFRVLPGLTQLGMCIESGAKVLGRPNRLGLCITVAGARAGVRH